MLTFGVAVLRMIVFVCVCVFVPCGAVKALLAGNNKNKNKNKKKQKKKKIPNI